MREIPVFSQIGRAAQLASMVVFSSISQLHAADVTWEGSQSDAWENGLNWDNGTGPVAGDVIYINSGTVDYSTGDSPSFRSVRLLGGTMTLSGGTLKSTFNSSWDCLVNGTFRHIRGTAEFNELEVGRYAADTGQYQLSGGDLVVARGLNGFSLYLGANHDSRPGGTGSFEISGGSMITRTGVRLGDTSGGTGIFSVIGSEATSIGIGSQGTNDGWWEQNAGSTFKVRVDDDGLTKTFIDDVESTGSTYATFANGSLLDVAFLGSDSTGTWRVLEVENGDIVDLGLEFAPGVDTELWSFSIDNSGPNGVLRVTAGDDPYETVLKVGDTPKQKMRYGIDYERLWYWTNSMSSSEKARVAEWSVTDCDVDYIRVAINSAYELSEGDYDLRAYTNKIIPMMTAMKTANPEIKFFGSPRPLDEAVSGARWQPYPKWITGDNGSSFNFDEQKCAEYLIRYLLLMKSYDFKISFMDLTNEWNYVTATDVRDISDILDEYLLDPWPHPALDPSLLLTADDIPLLIAPSAWSYSQGSGWLNGVNTSTRRDALDIAACHNTNKTGTAQDFADKVAQKCNPGTEIWNTELHGWKSTSGADEVLTSSFMFEAIRAGFSGINGWLAIGTTNQGHCYILNPSGNPSRNVKYYIFEKITNTSNYGHAFDINQPAEFTTTAALIRGNLMTVWVINDSGGDLLTKIDVGDRTISDLSVKRTRWSTSLPIEGVVDTVAADSTTEIGSMIETDSLYCYEILLDPESEPYDRIEAEDYQGSHVSPFYTEDCLDADGGRNIGNINKDYWCRYDDLALDAASSIRFRVAAPAGRPDGVIEVRLDAEDGPVIGRVAVPATGGWQTWQTIETPLDPVSGTHSIYLKFVEAGSNTVSSKSMFNLNWFSIPTALSPDGLTASPEDASRIALGWNSVEGAANYKLKRSTTSDGPYEIIAEDLTSVTHLDSGVSEGRRYYYVASAVFEDRESPDSGEASAVPSNPVPDVILLGPVSVVGTGPGVGEFSFSVKESQSGHFHQLQASDDLGGSGWENIGEAIPGNGGELLFEVPINSSEKSYFYRVVIERQ